jgi:hypothetical protein
MSSRLNPCFNKLLIDASEIFNEDAAPEDDDLGT